MYDNFYRNQLSEYYQEKKNILKDKPYITFMLGAVFIPFINSLYSFPITKFEEYFSFNIAMFFVLIILIGVISFVIYSANDSILDKSKDINKLIFYTEFIFLNDENKK